jgi:hypothetical protein
LEQALAIYTAADFRRWEIEARLLAGQAFHEIASQCDSEPLVIETFHAIFFHVQPFLQMSVYINNNIIGEKLYCGLTEADVDVILKIFAFEGGLALLERAIKYYRQPPVIPDRLDQLEEGELRELYQGLLIRAQILSRMILDDGNAIKKLVVVRQAVTVLERLVKRQSEASSHALEAWGGNSFGLKLSDPVLEEDDPLWRALEEMTWARKHVKMGKAASGANPEV